jgi:hypothetical protein
MKWEYRVEVLDPRPEGIVEGAEAFLYQLNDLGREGWELVSVLPSIPGKADPLAFFRRPFSN